MLMEIFVLLCGKYFGVMCFSFLLNIFVDICVIFMEKIKGDAL